MPDGRFHTTFPHIMFDPPDSPRPTGAPPSAPDGPPAETPRAGGARTMPGEKAYPADRRGRSRRDPRLRTEGGPPSFPIPAVLAKLAPRQHDTGRLRAQLQCVPDPRSRRGRWYPLVGLLLICACAVVSGAQTVTEITGPARSRP
ncbi:transposase family protein [Streptomyces sp. NPDC021020]|uniref:transposase family protein n=1 Tax=Streptomyces sp. NPDC021020 TaxID=3365109 RepID=UPI0037B4BFA8